MVLGRHCNLRKVVCIASLENTQTHRETVVVSAFFNVEISEKVFALQALKTNGAQRETVVSAVFNIVVSEKVYAVQALKTSE